MGEASRKLANFRGEHPYCCYCGGTWATETRDHAPPITMFWDRQRPDGLVVPACRFCNQRHALFDDFFGLLALSQGSAISNRNEQRIENLISSAARRFPTSTQELAQNGRDGFLSINGLFRPVTQIKFESDEIHFVICYMAARLALASYYDRTGCIAAKGSRLLCDWRPIAQPFPADFEEAMLSMLPHYRTLQQGRVSASAQFEMRYQAHASDGMGGFFFNFHSSFKAIALLLGPQESAWEVKDGIAHLFEVGEECIQPINCAFPPDLRLNDREPKEETR